jgi:hypothetical protein
MPNFITIDTITGVEPYHIYLCDTNFENCIYINTINDVDIPYTFELPPIYADSQNIVIRFENDGGCGVNSYLNTQYKACRYSQWETLFWMTYQGNPLSGPFSPINSYLSSFIVNGNELLTGYVDLDVTGPVTPVLQNGVYNYPTIVDWLNNTVFPSLSLSGYTAQMSFLPYDGGSLDSSDIPYFYIIYPKDDTFSIVVNTWSTTLTYSNTGVTPSSGTYSTYTSDCNITTIKNEPTGPVVVE